MISKAKAGKTGEKYITYDKGIDRFVVLFSVGDTKQKKMGNFKNLDDAIMCRDKYLSEYEIR